MDPLPWAAVTSPGIVLSWLILLIVTWKTHSRLGCDWEIGIGDGSGYWFNKSSWEQGWTGIKSALGFCPYRPTHTYLHTYMPGGYNAKIKGGISSEGLLVAPEMQTVTTWVVVPDCRYCTMKLTHWRDSNSSVDYQLVVGNENDGAFDMFSSSAWEPWPTPNGYSPASEYHRTMHRH